MNNQSLPPRDADQAAPMQGLSEHDVASRLRQYGSNELPSQRQHVLARQVADIVTEPMFLLLIAAGAIYWVLGDPSDGVMLLAFVMVSMTITFVQQRKTERVLASLRDLSSPRALVIRNGEHTRVCGRDVVPGDLLVLEEGDRVAADGVLLACQDLLIDESMLTGESAAVAKSLPGPATPPADARVFSGTLVVQGRGHVRVDATGSHTQLGMIGKSLQALQPEPSPLQQELGLLVRRFALFGAALSLLLMLLYGWTRGDWLNGLLVAITLAMSILPEEFTVILTVFMALGAWRIAKQQVLTRHTPVIEALGSATVLCVDKTGTLTQNQMAVKAVVVGQRTVPLDGPGAAALPPDARQVLEMAVLASQPLPVDPMEKAFHRCLETQWPQGKLAMADRTLLRHYSLSKELMAMTQVWTGPGAGQLTIAAKGAPEAVIALCALDPLQAEQLLQQVRLLAEQGMRVLAVASADHAEAPLPAAQTGFAFTWQGLVALADPLRPEVPSAIAKCKQAGIRVIMMTGDFPITAQAIAREAGLPYAQYKTGAQLQAMDEAALRKCVAECHVFARILPDQKLRLVTALKANGEVVAMTGDGINDAPALKAAHIGISMGARGTDVAREASSLVLLNDDFNAVVHAIELGRRIYANLRKALSYVVAVHIPIAGTVMLPVLFGIPTVFAPIHIVFLEMIINPTCAIVFEIEAAEQDCMRRPPRRASERLFGAANISLSVLQGLGLLAAAMSVLLAGHALGQNAGQSRAMAFACVVFGNMVLIVSSRSASTHLLALLRIPNPAQWWILGIVATALALVLHMPALQEVFHFSTVQAHDYLYPVLAGLAAALWCESIKWAFGRAAAPASREN